MPPALLALISAQCGVVSRTQLLDAGLRDFDIARLRRRRALVQVHRGVYIDHTGEPTWQQRCWAAVLALQPAALAGDSALRAAEGRDAPEASPVHVVVPWELQRRAPKGVVATRSRHFARGLHPGSGVPRVRYEQAVLDSLEGAASEAELVSVLTGALNSRLTSVARLRGALAARARVRGRDAIDSLLTDVATGVCSVLEHAYLVRVEQPHGLPSTTRQVRTLLRSGVVYRDTLSARHALCLELDGRLHERAEQRERDFDRDLGAAAEGLQTVRLSYGQVFRRPCWTAAQLARVYRARGWGGQLRSCGPECGVAATAG